MRKYKNHRVSGKMLIVSLLALVIATLGSCRKESSDISSILSTVPSSAGAVVGFDLKSLLEKAGCKVEGSSVKSGKELDEWLSSLGDDNERVKLFRMFLNGDSGIDPEGMVIFMDAYNTYATAMLADTEKFASFIESRSEEKFSSQAGSVKVCGNVAIKGAQMWIAVDDSRIDAGAVLNYSGLSDNQNFLSKNVSEPMTEMKADIVGWGDISVIAKKFLSFSQLAQYNMIVGALFDSPTSLAFSADFQKGELHTVFDILNDKGETAKFLLPAKKIDVDVVKSVGGNADVLYAGNLSKDLSKKIEGMVKSFGAGFFDSYLKPLAQIDGTVAVAEGERKDGKAPLSGVVQTDGENNVELMNFLSQFGATRKDGKDVRFSSGEMSGVLSVENSAADLKGAWMGCVASLDNSDTSLRCYRVALKPNGNGLRLDASLKGKDSSKNILLGILKDFSKK